MVQGLNRCCFAHSSWNLNTSHVMVQGIRRYAMKEEVLNLNTSHVMVQVLQIKERKVEL